MKFERLKHLPAPDGELQDWTIYSQFKAESRVNLLVYATKRDFLSAPISYALLLLDSKDKKIIANEYTIYEYFDDALSVPEQGIHRSKENDQKIFVVGESVIEMSFKRAKVIQQLYYCASSAEALENYLAELN